MASAAANGGPLPDEAGSRAHANGSMTPNETTALLHNGQPNGGASAGEDAEDERTVIAAEMSTFRLALILGTSYVGVFFGAVDMSIIATLSAPISSEFHSLSLLSWLATSYLIANAAFQPISGRLTDIFGRGPGLVASNVFFGAGNLLCGLARDEPTILAGRVVAGIGGGCLMSISTFLASDLVPLRQRGIIQGVGNIAYGAGAMLGGVFGGVMNDSSVWGWRLAFLVQVPVSAVSAVLVFFLVRVPPKASSQSLLSRIDFMGAFLTILFLVLLLLGLNAGGNLVSWTDPLVLTTLPLSLAVLVAFFWWERRVPHPVIPVQLLADRTVFAACMANLICSMAQLMLVFYIPLYLQVLGHSATQAGLRILASPIGISIASFGAGWAMKRTGRYVLLGVASLLVLAAGSVCVATFDEHTPEWLPFVAFALLGAGYGAMLTVTLLACIAAVDHAHQAVITSATYACRSIGSTVGVTIGSAVYQNILKARLWDRFGDLPGAADEIRRIRDDLDELNSLPEGWRDGVIASFMDAFRGVWFTALGLVLLGLLCVSLMRHHKLYSNLARTVSNLASYE